MLLLLLLLLLLLFMIFIQDWYFSINTAINIRPVDNNHPQSMITTIHNQKAYRPIAIMSKLVLHFVLLMNSAPAKKELKIKIIISANVLLSIRKLLQNLDLKFPELLWVSHVKISNHTHKYNFPLK